MTVQHELTNKVQEIIQNHLIMQWEDMWQLRSIVLGGSLNLLVEEVIKAWLINLLCDG